MKLYPLHKMPYGELPLEVEDGVMFCTYQSLIAQNKSSERRIDQIVQWAAGSRAHYHWTLMHATALADEYQHRAGVKHMCQCDVLYKRVGDY